MIKFIKDNGKALIINDISEENGWVIWYDQSYMLFHIWENIENYSLNKPFDKCCGSLEEAFEIVEGYT